MVCLSDRKVDDYGPLAGYCKEIITVERRMRFIKDFSIFFFGKDPFNSVKYSSLGFRSALQGLLQRQSFDIVQIEFSLMWQYADIFRGIPVVLDAHNIEYEIIRQIKDTCGNPIKKILYSLEEKKLKYKEEEAWKKCNLCLTVSDKERDVIDSYLGHSNKVFAIPNGVDLKQFEFHPKADMGKQLLFIGGMDYQPNLDSARHFLKEIFPLIQSKVPDVKLDIVGRELWKIDGRASVGGVEFHENVPDVLPYFGKADVLVVPLRYGAGTRIKILEAMATGLPVVTTSRGCEGIHVKHAEHLMIADSPSDFASAVQRLLKDINLKNSITQNARSLVEEKYSWEMLVGKMERFYSKV